MVDKVVAVVGNTSILYSDLREEMETVTAEREERGGTYDRDLQSEALERLLVKKLLYTHALLDSVEINTDGVSQAVERQLAAMTEQAGSVAALEARMGRPYYEVRQSLRDDIEEQAYASAMQSTIVAGVTVTPGEVERFYRKLAKNDLPPIPEQYVYAHIVRYPTSTEEARQRVREQLLDLRRRAIEGSRFDMLARMYSMDEGTAMKGGEMTMALEEWVQPFADAVAKLQPGQISEVVETEFGFHIIELVERRGDNYRVRHILLRPTYTNEELAADGRFLDSLAGVISRGDMTFADAARQYSDDRFSRNNGGVVTNHEYLENYGYMNAAYSTTRFMKEQLPDDYPHLKDLRGDEISRAYRSRDMRGNVLTKIVKIVEVIPSHQPNLNDDYIQIEQLAMQSKQDDVFDEWLDEKIDGTFIRIEPEFRGSDFMNTHWVK